MIMKAMYIMLRNLTKHNQFHFCYCNRMNKFLAVLVLATMAIAGANAQACPTIISRVQWGARDAG